MFSGLVREMAEVRHFAHNTLEILTAYQARLGDSIAINGTCLTVMGFCPNGVKMELSRHTQDSIAIENYKSGSLVHFEPALQMGDRLDGHIVQGHIDGIGRIVKIAHNADSSDFWIESSPQMLSFVIPKGSICVDGISLTITERTHNAFKLTLIPHTLQNTLFGSFKVGRRVNLESDVITRTVVSTLKHISQYRAESSDNPSWSAIDAINLGY